MRDARTGGEWRMRPKNLRRRRIQVVAIATFAVLIPLVGLGGLGYATSAGLSSAQADQYSTTTTTGSTTTSTTTTTTTTPTSTKPGKGCGDKNHLHERRFECKIEISDVQGKEGKSGTTAFTFVVSLSGNPLSPVTVDYASASGTASTPSDFQSASGTLTFPIGVNTKTITVAVVGDRTRERNETFFVNLSNPSANAYIGDGQGLGTIVDDD